MPTVYFLLARGFEECEALIPADLLKRAGANVILAATEGGLAVPGAHGITVTADITIDELRKEDMSCIVLPGGMPGTTNLAKNARVLDLIEYSAERGIYIAHPRYLAICACSTAETPPFTPISHRACRRRTLPAKR